METRSAVLLALVAYLFVLTSIGRLLKLVIFLAVWLPWGGTQYVHFIRNTYKRDWRMATRGFHLLFRINRALYKDMTVVSTFREVLKANPDKVMYVNCTDNTEWTYQQIEEYSNRVSHFFRERGFVKGDAVALFMENRPEYVGLWLGLAKVGVVPALINYNLRHKSLVHTIQVAECKAIIYGLELEQAVSEIQSELSQLTKSGKAFPLFHSKAGSDLAANVKSQLADSVNLDEKLKKCSVEPEPEMIRKSIHSTDPLLYIYTSGTTGLPKAVIIKHIRQLFVCMGTYTMIGLREDDVIYCHLPLYHSSGGQIAISGSLFFGTKTVIKKKFSASAFWKDCIAHRVTATQHIGEIARFLLARPPSPEDKKHGLRIIFGNGLKPELWTKFVERFNIPNVAEFYGATEGNSNLINLENRVGAVGFLAILLPAWLRELLLPVKVVRVDKETGELLKDQHGYAMEIGPGESGEMIGRIVRGDPIKDFEGYRDQEATKKKVIRDVFKKGDLYFRSGDILYMDEFGWVYFKDRSGDTFRWRGENVSTTEVEATVSGLVGMREVTAYGVEVPNNDGRAGMVAIPVEKDSDVDLQKVYAGVVADLPPYARPVFLRLVKEGLDLTGTYKLKKTSLQEAGFDVRKISDQLFFLDSKAGKYVPLTPELHDDILSAKIRL